MSANVPYQTISRLAGRREGSQVRYLLRCQQRVTSSAKEIQAIAVLVDRVSFVVSLGDSLAVEICAGEAPCDWEGLVWRRLFEN